MALQQLCTTSALMQQVCRPIAIGLLCRLQALSCSSSALPAGFSGGRLLHSGAHPRLRRRRMDCEEGLSPKSSPTLRKARDSMGASIFSSAFRGPSLMPPPQGADFSTSAAPLSPSIGLTTPNQMETQPSLTDLVREDAAASVNSTPVSEAEGTAQVTLPPILGLSQHNKNGSSSNDFKSEIILDPATPRTPKHQLAEQVMTTGTTAQVLKRHMDAVIKVFATHTKPNFELPWQRRQQYTSKSTGFAVKTEDGERWLLTNAHSVSYATTVQLKRRGDDEKYMARVLAIGTECDLALLSVEDDEFWDGVTPLELGELPALQENVAVLGYPIGGDSLAISAGVVSRVQMTHYSHGCMSLLAVQTDAAINSGNSGGPVMNARGQCIGVAFQSLTGDTQSIGYVIPTSVVRHFMNDYTRNKRYTGFPSLNITWQEMDSKALKRAYGMAPHQKGVLLRGLAAASEEAKILKADDILLRIDGVELGNDGSVPFRHGERVDFKYLITHKFVGDVVKLDILRDGKERSVEVRLKEFQHLVPPHLHNGTPSYFLVGGLVFTACSDPYLVQRYGGLGSSPVRLMAKTYFGLKESADQQVVVLSHILACNATMGYESTVGIKDSPVLSFNGSKVQNLAHLARLVVDALDDPEQQYLRFDLESSSKVVLLEAKAAKACTQKIMDDHSIGNQMSKDVETAISKAREEKAPLQQEP